MTTTVLKTVGTGKDYSTLQSCEDAKPTDFTTSRSFTCVTGGTSSNIIFDAGASAVNDFYKGHAVWANARSSEKRIITAYDGTTKIAAIGALNGSNATWDNTPTVEACTLDAVIWQACANNQTFAGGGSTILTVSGSTTNTSNYFHVTTDTGCSFFDNANLQTNALKPNASNGALITGTGNSYNPTVVVGENNTHFSKLQISKASGGGSAIGASGGPTGLDFNLMLVETNGAQPVLLDNTNVTGHLRNSVLTVRSNHVAVWVGSQFNFENVDFVCPSDLTPPTAAIQKSAYRGGVFKNVRIFGFTAVENSSGGTATYTTCCSDVASPPSGIAGGKTYANEYVTTTDASRDFRTKSGAYGIDTGTTDSTNAATAINNKSRPQGSAYDMGAWEYAASGSNGTATPTGVSGSGAASAPTALVTVVISPTGVSGTGAVGTPAEIVTTATTLTGVQSSGAMGAMIETVTTVVPVVGISGAGAVGGLVNIVDEIIAVSGVSGAGGVGAVVATNAQLANPVGVSGAGALSAPSVVGETRVGVGSVSGVGGVGAPIGVVASAVTVTSVNGVAAVNGAAASVSVNQLLSGVVGAGSVTAPTASVPATSATANLTGVSGSGAIGSVGAATSAGLARLTGVSGAGVVSVPAVADTAAQPLDGVSAGKRQMIVDRSYRKNAAVVVSGATGEGHVGQLTLEAEYAVAQPVVEVVAPPKTATIIQFRPMVKLAAKRVDAVAGLRGIQASAVVSIGAGQLGPVEKIVDVELEAFVRKVAGGWR